MSTLTPPTTRTAVGLQSSGEPGGSCHVVDDTSPTGTLCGIELPAGRGRSRHSLYACPRNGGNRCVLCPECERLLAARG